MIPAAIRLSTWNCTETSVARRRGAYRSGRAAVAGPGAPTADGEPDPGRSDPAQQVGLLGLVLLGADRAAVAQVGEIGERPRDVVGRHRRWRRRGGRGRGRRLRVRGVLEPT